MTASAPLLRAPGPFDDEAGTHLLVLHRLLLAHLGPSYRDLDSAALREEITERFGGLGDVAWNRVQAGRLLATNDMAWEEWGVFEKVVSAVAGEMPDFAYMQPPEAEDVARTLLTMAELAQPDFHYDVVAYIGAACLHDGLWYLEAPLDISRPVITEYVEDKKLDLPFDQVRHLLASRSRPFANPDSPAEVQLNEVLAVREDLAEFRQELMDQAVHLRRPRNG